MNEDPLALLPELALLIGAVAALLSGAFLPRPKQWVARWIALASLASTIVAAALTTGQRRTVYDHSYAIDLATSTARIIIAAAALLVVVLSAARVAGSRRETEFYVLVLLASLGATVLAGTSDLLMLAVGYLLASIPLYALAGWDRKPRGAEAALKVYLLGALFGIIMLLGIVVLTGGAGGATSYAQLHAGLRSAPKAAVALGVVAVFAGLLFKMGAVPAHFWIPDVAAGATTPAATFVTTVPKIGGLVAAYRFVAVLPDGLVNWRLLLAILAALSMTLGNLAAFRQTDPKRLLGYSTISQVGYLLMAVVVVDRTDNALPALLTYLAAYAASNLGAFAVVGALPERRTLAEYSGAGREHPLLIAVLIVCLLGLVGTPPTAVFIGKLTVFTAAWDGGQAWLVAVAAVNTIASLYYYLRWLAPAAVHRRSATTPIAVRPLRPWAASAAGAAGVAALAAGLVAIPLFGVNHFDLVR